MTWLSSTLTDVASVLYDQQSQREAIAQSALARGAKLIQDKNYDGAISAFKCAASIQPDLTDAYTYMGKTYMFLGKYDEAVTAYQKAVRTDTQSADTHLNLANACIQAKKYGDAERELKAAIAIEPGNTDAHVALGHVYLTTDRVLDAELEFKNATRLSPTNASGFYSLGVAYNKAGEYTQAIAQFERAISLDHTYADAYSDMAYSYIGLGQKDRAQEQVTALQNLNTSQASALANQLKEELFTPKIYYAEISKSSFSACLGPGTSLSLLDSSLATPGAVKTFSMVFQFNQAMDPSSVMTTTNWSISRATGGDAGVYDNGVVLHRQQEAQILPLPIAVYYDPQTYKATIYFTVRQNDAGDATIDPSHWVFKFSGTDIKGNPMDPSGDEFDGFALFPF